jgi:hypothetical protein
MNPDVDSRRPSCEPRRRRRGPQAVPHRELEQRIAPAKAQGDAPLHGVHGELHLLGHH